MSGQLRAPFTLPFTPSYSDSPITPTSTFRLVVHSSLKSPHLWAHTNAARTTRSRAIFSQRFMLIGFVNSGKGNVQLCVVVVACLLVCSNETDDCDSENRVRGQWAWVQAHTENSVTACASVRERRQTGWRCPCLTMATRSWAVRCPAAAMQIRGSDMKSGACSQKRKNSCIFLKRLLRKFAWLAGGGVAGWCPPLGWEHPSQDVEKKKTKKKVMSKKNG